jgi:hypothetical protein
MDQAQAVQICLPEQASAKEPEHAPIGGLVSVLPTLPVTQCDIQTGVAYGTNLGMVRYDGFT